MNNKGYIRLLLLYYASKDGDKSGYSLMRDIGKFTGKIPSTGTVYPILNDLEDKGFITTKYGITKEGKKHLATLTSRFYDDLEYMLDLCDLINGKPHRIHKRLK